MGKTKQRRGIGWYGRVFQYGTANGPGGATMRIKGPAEGQEENTRTLNKLPEFKRAAKKALRRDDMKFASAQ